MLVRIDGVDLAYDEAGAGPAVVLVHAGLADRRMWEHQFAALARDHRVIRYDWRGYGGSGDAAGSFAHHEDLLALLDALDVGRATLVGCSMGAAHAVDVALTAPDRVAGLVLICPGLSGHRWPAEMLAEVREQVHSAVPADRLQRYHRHAAGEIVPDDVTAMAQAQVAFMVVGPGRARADIDPAVWDRAVMMCERVFERLWSGPGAVERELEPPARARLHEISAPALVINGRSDVRYVQAVADILTEGISGARRIDLADTGHLAPLERATEVTAALTELLAGGAR